MKNRIGSTVLRDKMYSRSRASRLRSLRLETLEGRQLLTAAPTPVHNALIAEDTNLDFRVSAMDALLVVNHLNARSAAGEGELTSLSQSDSRYLDVNNDSRVSALDALQVINRLNGEGEEDILMVYSYSITNVVDPDNTASAAPISQISVGQTFQLNVFFKDNRDIASLPVNSNGKKIAGPYSGGLDMGLSSTTLASYQFSSNFLNGVLFASRYGEGRTATQGTPENLQYFNEVFSASASTAPPDDPGSPKPFYSVRFVANNPGTLTFTPNGPEVADSENLLYGSTSVIPNDMINFGGPFSITIIADPTTPVANPDTLTTNEDTALAISNATLLSNDTSPATPPRTLEVTGIQTIPGTTQGTLSGNQYTPPAHFNGSDRLTYTIRDASGLVATSTITINVSAVNDAPTAGNDSPNVVEDSTDNTLTVLTNDSPGPANESGQNLTIISVGTTSNGGTVSIAAGGQSLNYTPADGFIGTETFTYTVRDSGTPALTATATVTVTVEPATLPRARRDTATVNEESTNNSIDVLANDLANTGRSKLLVSFAQPANGTVTRNDNGTPSDTSDDRLVYAPNGNFFGTDTFTYVMNDTSDPQGASSTGTVTVTVNNVNDAPTLVNDPVAAEENVTRTITFSSLLTNDSPGPNETTQSLTITSVSAVSATGGTVRIEGTNVIYTPTPSFSGQFLFTYNATDNGTPALSAANPATVTVNVTEFNDPPVLQNDTDSTLEDVAKTIALTTLTSNDSPGPSEASQTLTVTGVSALTNGGGLVQIQGGNVVYTPAANFNGPFQFTYTARDNGFPEKSSTATVTINVTPVNNAPQAGADTVRAFKNNALLIPIATLLGNDSKGPANEASQTLSIISVGSATGGTVSLDSTAGIVNFTPANDFIGNASFRYTLRDNGGTANGGVDTAEGQVSVAVEEFQPSTIGGKVWVDEDRDNAIDTKERFLGGITVTLTGNSLGQTVAARSVETAADGSYQFVDLGPGSYQISFQAPPFLNGTLNSPSPKSVSISEPGGANVTRNHAMLGYASQYALWVSQLVSNYNYQDGSRFIPGAFMAIAADNSLQWSMKLDGYQDAVFTEAVFQGDNLLFTTVGADRLVRTARLSRSEYSMIKDSAGNSLVHLKDSANDLQWAAVNRSSPGYNTPTYLEAVDDFFEQMGWDS